ncbi:hypothetical protein [Psychrobacter proteolyticus]|uniref:hypothetical protein n=1 Tax=Psychrobacter proteolyticus TaxID=147825 RepID=UPI0019190C82|nr:hypothetical protein [Psychrobacter proteolyticus]
MPLIKSKGDSKDIARGAVAGAAIGGAGGSTLFLTELNPSTIMLFDNCLNVISKDD